MDPSHMEISAYFATPERWSQHLARLRDPACTVHHVRLFHNTPADLTRLLDALFNNTSITSLDIQSLDPAGGRQLSAMLAKPSTSSVGPQQLDALLMTNCAAVTTSISQPSASLSEPQTATTIADATTPPLLPLGSDRGDADLAGAGRDSRGNHSGDSGDGGPNHSGGDSGPHHHSDAAAPMPSPSANPTPAAAWRLHTLRLPQLSDPSAAALIADGLRANHSLRHLHVGGLKATGVEHLAHALAGRRRQHGAVLDSLRLERCSMRDEGGVASSAGVSAAAGLGAAVAAAQVRQLSVVESGWGDAEVAALVQGGGLALGKQLEMLDLERNAVCCAGAQALSDSLLRHSDRLHHLRLANNCIADAGAAAIATAIAACEPGPSPLHVLDLQHNTISPLGVSALAAALSFPSCRLQRLNLDHNVLGGGGLHVLLSAAVSAGGGGSSGSSSSSLRELRMEGCGASLAAAVPATAAASAALPRSEDNARSVSTAVDCATTSTTLSSDVTPQLEGLWLAHNRLGDAGVAVLRGMLACGPVSAIKHIDLCDNAIGDAGVDESVIPMLHHHPQLVTLLLDGNRVRCGAARRLVAAALAHPALWHFRADNKRVTDPDVRAALLEATHVLAGREYRAVRRGIAYWPCPGRDGNQAGPCKPTDGDSSSNDEGVAGSGTRPLPERHAARRARQLLFLQQQQQQQGDDDYCPPLPERHAARRARQQQQQQQQQRQQDHALAHIETHRAAHIGTQPLQPG